MEVLYKIDYRRAFPVARRAIYLIASLQLVVSIKVTADEELQRPVGLASYLCNRRSQVLKRASEFRVVHALLFGNVHGCYENNPVPQRNDCSCDIGGGYCYLPSLYILADPEY